MGFQHPTTVQNLTLPAALRGEDILATAETGSGKTAAFLLPIVERISKSPHVLARRSASKNKKGAGGQVATKALVLLPARELASQCYSMFQKIVRYSNITGALIAGGFSAQEQVGSGF